MQKRERFERPEEMARVVERMEEAYVIKLKCLGCTETKFFPFEKVAVGDGVFKIGSRSFPLNLLEQITVRTKEEYVGKAEYIFSVSSLYFRRVLNEEAKEELKKHNLY